MLRFKLLLMDPILAKRIHSRTGKQASSDTFEVAHV